MVAGGPQGSQRQCGGWPLPPILPRRKRSSRKRAEKSLCKPPKTRYEAQTNDNQAAWQFGVACFDWADFATSDSQREEIARQGIGACSGLIQRDPKSVAGGIVPGMDLGRVAQTKLLEIALKIVDQMEGEFKTARPGCVYDFAGPDRNLGLLYRDAPGWPASIGNKSKARQHLQQALKLAPD